MKHVNPSVIYACQQAFITAKRQEPIGIWCSQKALTAALTEFCRAHGEILWDVRPPEGVTVPVEYTGCYGAEFGQWYAEIEEKDKGWTAYLLDTNVEDGDWIPVPGTPFNTKEKAAKQAEEYMRHGLSDSGAGVVSGPVCGQDGGVAEPELNYSLGGTREYLTRDD